MAVNYPAFHMILFPATGACIALAASCWHELLMLLNPRTFDELLVELSRFTDEQRSLAWSPEPPFVSTGAHDCRIGGGCGLDFNNETPRARWIQARYRWKKSGEATLKESHES